MIKNFTDWFKLKPKLDSEQNIAPLFQEREVWNCHLGINVGYEVDGKREFLRPVLIFKKLSHQTFLGIPLTSKPKNGSWYSKSFVQDIEGRYILAQIRLMDSKRLHSKIAKITDKELKAVKSDFISLIT